MTPRFLAMIFVMCVSVFADIETDVCSGENCNVGDVLASQGEHGRMEMLQTNIDKDAEKNDAENGFGRRRRRDRRRRERRRTPAPVTWTDWGEVLSGVSGTWDDAETTATCPSGTTLTGCTCYSPWASCDGAKSSGNTCTAWNKGEGGIIGAGILESSGVYAQARCGTLPGSSGWTEVLSAKSGSHDDAPTTATCPSGLILTGCTCYSPWWSCDGAKSSGDTCTAYNKANGLGLGLLNDFGVYAQARCGKIPGSSQWTEVLSDKSALYDDAPTYATCPTGETLTGCTCYSPWNACDGALSSGETCTAYNKHLGLGVYAQARCGYIPAHTLAPVSSPTPPPVVHGCEHWCSADTRAWTSKCNFPLCNGCSACPSLVEEHTSETSNTGETRTYCWCYDYYADEYIQQVFFDVDADFDCTKTYRGSRNPRNSGTQLACKNGIFKYGQWWPPSR